MPSKSLKDGQPCLAHARIQLYTDAHGTPRASRKHVAQPPMSEFRAQLALAQKGKVPGTDAAHEFLD
jgi:hypothetical protein